MLGLKRKTIPKHLSCFFSCRHATLELAVSLGRLVVHHCFLKFSTLAHLSTTEGKSTWSCYITNAQSTWKIDLDLI